MSTLTKPDPRCTELTFIGNRRATALDLVGPDKKTLREKYLVGDPRDCPTGDTEEMKRLGYVGIYSREPLPAIGRLNLPLRQSWWD